MPSLCAGIVFDWLARGVHCSLFLYSRRGVPNERVVSASQIALPSEGAEVFTYARPQSDARLCLSLT